ncbi:uncharacterized protein METZ01_LOCUS5311 [marine metagenome]|uniref:Uncharacterized protein n=1 Tax=marine metagenome TaxID=408172 RepID=A0A381ND52_9ZZZZ
MSIAINSLFVTDGLCKCLAQRDSDVFYRMMRVNFYVSRRVNF